MRDGEDHIAAVVAQINNERVEESSVARVVFDARRYEPRDRFRLYREFAEEFVHASAPLRTGAEFYCHHVAYSVGDCMIAVFRMVGHHVERPSSLIARDGLDHYHVVTHLKASSDPAKGDDCGRGDFHAKIVANPFEVLYTADVHVVNLIIPRWRLAPKLKRPDSVNMHARRPGPFAVLARDALSSLAKVVGRMTPADAAVALSPIIELVAAALNEDAEATERGPDAVCWALSQKIKHYIDENLCDPSFGVEDVCAAFRMSRATLYRVFTEEGGVAEYVRNRRLQRALRVLRAGEARDITTLAIELGFRSSAVFSRAFKRRFDLTPTEARELVAADVAQSGERVATSREWKNWFLT